MLFVLNRNPSRMYRALLNPFRQGTIELLLEEVSAGLQVDETSDHRKLFSVFDTNPSVRGQTLLLSNCEINASETL